MKLLGLDYGRRKIGLALAEGPIAEPFAVLEIKSLEEAFKKTMSVVEKEGVEEIIIGCSEGEVGREARGFGLKLHREGNQKVKFQDETLTTQDAQRLSLKAGIGRVKRKRMEDAYSAALILQSFLENLEK